MISFVTPGTSIRAAESLELSAAMNWAIDVIGRPSGTTAAATFGPSRSATAELKIEVS
jgi:hypothetical protein